MKTKDGKIIAPKKSKANKYKERLMILIIVIGSIVYISFTFFITPNKTGKTKAVNYAAVDSTAPVMEQIEQLEKLEGTYKSPQTIKKENIRRQFSHSDGSHYKLQRLIKKQLKNRDSYEHIRTQYWVMTNHIVVRTTYRATNSINATVIESLKAKFTLDGNFIEWLSE